MLWQNNLRTRTHIYTNKLCINEHTHTRVHAHTYTQLFILGTRQYVCARWIVLQMPSRLQWRGMCLCVPTQFLWLSTSGVTGKYSRRAEMREHMQMFFIETFLEVYLDCEDSLRACDAGVVLYKR